jgi:glycosyltransferase involved in cell wall biosynthesis
MRVVRIITRLNIGGPSIQAAELASRLRRHGIETVLVHGQVASGEGDMRYLLQPDVNSRHVPALRRRLSPASDAAAFFRILAILREVQPHIVHTHMAKAGTLGRLAAGVYNRTTGRSSPARVVHTYHGHVLEGYFNSGTARFFTWTERQLARLTDAIVAISPRIRAELVDEFHVGRPEQYRVVPLGFDLSELNAITDRDRLEARRALEIPHDACIVTTVGRLTAIKQHRLFLDVARLVARDNPRSLFLIAGDGELRADLERYARELGLGERVRFLGWRRDLAVLYAATDVFLLTSRNEGTPVALIESLAAGVAGVSTDVGGVRDVIDSEDVGLLAPSGDADALAQQVSTLLADPDRARRMGASGRETIVARYNVERLVDDIAALYRELAGPV